MVKRGMKAVGYIRVSTGEQALEGVSLEAQEAKVRAYAELHGLEFTGLFADEGISGKRADNRPGLQSALERVCKVQGVLVVMSLSRLARSTKDAIHIAEKLEACGADLASITEKIDTTSSMGRFFFRLMASLGELEREQVSERTTAAMNHKRAKGQRISRHIPYGYSLSDDGELLIAEPTEQKTLAKMKRWRVKGDSFRAIAEKLDAAGVQPKTGRQWYASSVRSVLLTADRRAASGA